MNDVAYVVETLSSALHKAGVRVRVVGRRAGNPSAGRTSFTGQTLRSFVGIATAKHHDILHINYGLFGFLALMEPQKVVVLHLHGSDIRSSDDWRGKVSKWVSEFTGRLMKAVWYSTPDLGAILTRMGLAARFMPNPVLEAFFRTPLPVPDRPNILFAVPLSGAKGAAKAIDAMELLRAEDPWMRISAFGFGPDPEEASRYRSSLPTGVHALDWVPHSQMPSVIANATVVVGQLELGILGITELEALAAGRPVVSYIDRPLPSLERYYGDGPPVFSGRQPNEVVDAVRYLVHHPTEAAEAGLLGQSWAARYHSCSVVAREYRQAYLALLRERGG